MSDLSVSALRVTHAVAHVWSASGVKFLGRGSRAARLVDLEDTARGIGVRTLELRFQLVEIACGNAVILRREKQQRHCRFPGVIQRFGQYEDHVAVIGHKRSPDKISRQSA